MTSIDLNSDLGEGFGAWTMGDDSALLAIVSSANIACGFHAGDPSIMRRACEEAVERGVSIGAHVAYPDVTGFGRRFIDIAPRDLRDAVTYQIGALSAMAAAAGGTVAYVKPHGALYNAIVHHREQASAVVDGVRAVASLPVMGLPGSVVLTVAEQAGLRAVIEAFADRAYNADGTLVSRSVVGAVLHDAAEIGERALRMASEGVVIALDGTEIAIAAESLCVHGDTPGAVAIANAVRASLEEAGISIAPFVR